MRFEQRLGGDEGVSYADTRCGKRFTVHVGNNTIMITQE